MSKPRQIFPCNLMKIGTVNWTVWGMFLQLYFVTIYLFSANSNIIQMLMKESVLSIFVRCAVMAQGGRERGKWRGNKRETTTAKQTNKKQNSLEMTITADMMWFQRTFQTYCSPLKYIYICMYIQYINNMNQQRLI